MALAHSKLTAQGQISIPAVIRKKLGLVPGSYLEWEERSGEFIVRKAGRSSSLDIHKTLFGGEPAARPAQTIKEAIRTHIRRRHARD